MMTENSKVYKQHSYTKAQLKYKDSIPLYGDISFRVSTEVNPTIKSDQKQLQDFWDNMETAQGRRLLKIIMKKR